MGLTAIAADDWIEIDDLYREQTALRARLLAEHRDEVLGAMPDTEAVCRETLSCLTAHLCTRFPAWFHRAGAVLDNRLNGTRWTLDGLADHALVIAGHLVQEDLCLLGDGDDGPTLIAGVVCFPSHWRLHEKLGRPLAGIHGPVPFYQDRLARPVNRFLSLLKPGRFAVRLNWTVTDRPELFQPSGHGRADRNAAITAENAGEKLVLRVERQTFRRLPDSGTVVFGIRVHVNPLAAVVARPEEAARLDAAIRALPPEMQRYKSLAPFREALLAYLAVRANEPTA